MSNLDQNDSLHNNGRNIILLYHRYMGLSFILFCSVFVFFVVVFNLENCLEYIESNRTTDKYLVNKNLL